MNTFENLRETHISTEEIFDGVVLHVIKDDIRLPNGETSIREVIRHIGAVCMVPVTDDGKVIMEKQFRYAIDRVVNEIPAGKLDSADEDRLEAAQRELLEETGYTADKWVDMGLYYPACAYSDEKITMFLATGLQAGERKLDEDEFINVELVPIQELIEDIMSGKISDGKTQVAILKAAKILGYL